MYVFKRANQIKNIIKNMINQNKKYSQKYYKKSHYLINKHICNHNL